MATQKIRVLIVDDSALMRKKISEMINSSSDCEVIGAARDGYEALQIIQLLKPDVVTLDLQMPKMDGLTCLGYIMCEWPTPVIVLSAFTTEGSQIAIKALEYGAIDVLPKPGGVISPTINKLTDELLNKIRLASKVPISSLSLHSIQKAERLRFQCNKNMYKVILIGASTGGPRAITQILQVLPGDLPAAILLVQHMPKYFIGSFVNRLNEQCELEVKEAEAGDKIVPGRILVAPGGFNMEVTKRNIRESLLSAQIKLSANTRKIISPSIDITFCSAAEIFGPRILGIVLTGMGKDGTKGCLKIKQNGGKTIAEDESTCIVFGMPAAAIAAHAVDYVMPLDKIPQAILAEAGRTNE